MAAVHLTVKNNSGQTVGLTLDDETDAERIEYFKTLVKREDLAEVKVEAVEDPADKPLDKMKVDELRKYAADNSVDLGDATKKEDILAVIVAAEPSAQSEA